MDSYRNLRGARRPGSDPGAGETALAGIEFVARSPGTTQITITVHEMDDDEGSPVLANSVGGTLEVIDLRTVGDNDTPTDPDGDGRYEDVNGNGQVDYDDVVVLFTEKETGAVQNHPDAYDLNNNGGVDFDDIVDLAGEVTGD